MRSTIPFKAMLRCQAGIFRRPVGRKLVDGHRPSSRAAIFLLGTLETEWSIARFIEATEMQDEKERAEVLQL